MRRGVGIGAIKNKSLAHTKYKEKGQELADNQVSTLCRQVEQVKLALEEFAAKHRDKIRNNAQFRSQFQAMCSNIGVDPLAYSRGYWSEMLGLGEFYYHLGVRIIEVCMANQKRTGGLMPFNDVVTEVNRSRSSRESEISSDDVIRSIKKLRCLGNGFMLIRLPGGRTLVQSVPGELSMDQTNILALAETAGGRITVSCCVDKYKWSKDRAQTALNQLMQGGMAWIDDADDSGERAFWFPSLFQSSTSR